MGATGNVGREVLDIIDEREIQFSELVALASPKSKGTTIDYGENKSIVVGDFLIQQPQKVRTPKLVG